MTVLEHLIIVDDMGYLVEAPSVEDAKTQAIALYRETFSPEDEVRIVVGSTTVTPVMVGLCIATLRDRNNILLTEETVRQIIRNGHRFRELLLSNYTDATNPDGHLDTMERDYLYCEFAEQILGLEEWPRIAADHAEMAIFAAKIAEAEDAGKLVVVE
jgi:hypothetical protein